MGNSSPDSGSSGGSVSPGMGSGAPGAVADALSGADGSTPSAPTTNPTSEALTGVADASGIYGIPQPTALPVTAGPPMYGNPIAPHQNLPATTPVNPDTMKGSLGSSQENDIGKIIQSLLGRGHMSGWGGYG